MSDQKKIRVLEMIDDATLGGGQMHVLSLAKGLQRMGFDVSVACAREGFFVDELKKISIPHIPIRMDNRLRFRTLIDVIRILRRLRFDVLHTHGGTSGFWGRLGAMMARTPPVRIHTYHGLHYLNQSDFVHRIFYRIDRILARFTHRLICVCPSDFRKGAAAGLTPGKRTSVVANGIELESFHACADRADSRKKLDVPDNTFLFCHVGRLHLQKGQRYLLQAFAQVQKNVPDARLWIVGEGEMRPELENLALGLGIGSRVRFLGNRDDVPELLAASDVFVLASLWEGQPIALLEAMAAGKAIAATKVDGIEDILHDDQDALLVTPKDSAALAAAMMRLVNDEGLLSRLALAAQKMVETGFSVQRMADETAKIYLELAKRKP